MDGKGDKLSPAEYQRMQSQKTGFYFPQSLSAREVHKVLLPHQDHGTFNKTASRRAKQMYQGLL